MNDIYMLKKDSNEIEIVDLEDYLDEYYTEEIIIDIIQSYGGNVNIPFYGDIETQLVLKSLGVFDDIRDNIIEDTIETIEAELDTENFSEFGGDIFSYSKEILELERDL